jgi:ATP-binding cassette subfamily B protein
MKPRRRWLAREVVQTSDTDCGPAALKCLLEGFGIAASYGRLREACQTDVDGTSIDTIEDVASQLGLDASQVMVPADHFVHSKSLLPAVVVARVPGGGTHFVVVWRRHRGLLQMMDPAIGRRWISTNRFLESVYVHTARVPAQTWREWAASEPALEIVRDRLSSCGIDATPFVEAALRDPGWRGLAALEAGCRAVEVLVSSGALRRGQEASSALRRLTDDPRMIGREYWSVETADNQLAMRGAVLVHVAGVREPVSETALPPELGLALAEPPTSPGRELWRIIREDGVLAPTAALAGVAVAAAGVILEAVLFRSLLDVGGNLPLAGQRLAAAAALIALLIVLLVLDMRLAGIVARLGRQVEIRLRLAFLRKIPRLNDRYFSSRLKSDMAERSHASYKIRAVPEMAARFTRSSFELVFTAAAIAWIDPGSTFLAAAAAACAVGLPLAAQPVIREGDLRIRTHNGALCRFYLDALIGLAPIRSHGGARAVRREHGRVLGLWAAAALALQRNAVRVEAVHLLAAFGFAAWALLGHVGRIADAGTVLLLVYWFLNLPAIGEEIALVAWQYPMQRNTALRALEPLGAIEMPVSRPGRSAGTEPCTHGVSVRFERVDVRAAGHTILDNIDLQIPAGSHVAIVGASGAGKSSLAGLLLGWHRPAEGAVLVDGLALDGRLDALRHATAWVDPSVQIWNRPLADNLLYGATRMDERSSMAHAIEAAALWQVIATLPDGMSTALGESGALVSGGEGQRVRLARAMLRSDARLVILDEPFRGLDRADRCRLLARAREHWRRATMFFITHDIAHTTAFHRVVVLESGRIVEEGCPAALAADVESRYRAMLDAERAVESALWHGRTWRRARLEDGRFEAVGGTR